MTISFTLLVEPKSVQHGARVALRRGKIHHYNDAEKVAYQNAIILESRHHAPSKPLEGPIELAFKFWLIRPKGSKRVFMDCKPDLDNLCKGITDALSHCGFWKNDSQIVGLNAHKSYNDMAGLPSRIEVTIDSP